MPKPYTNYEVKFGIDQEVTDRFGRTGIVSGYYIWRAWFCYELEWPDKTWYEYPKYVKEVRSIWFNNDIWKN